MKGQFFGKSKLGISFLSIALILLCVVQVNAEEEDKPTCSLYADVFNQYIFRGVALSDHSAVIQPSITVGYKGFAVSLWGNYDTNEDPNFSELDGDANWNETDFTFSYTHELFMGLSGTVGAIYYSLVGDDSLEVYAGLSYPLPWLTVAVTGYREMSHFPGWWFQLDLSRNIALPCYGMSIDLGATFGYLESDDVGTNPAGSSSEFSGLLAGQILGAVNIPIGKYFAISPRVGYAFPLSGRASDRIEGLSWDGEEDHVFGGIRLSASF